MMTEYLLLEAIAEGKVKWDQKYTPDDYVYEISQDRSLSNVPLRKDGSYTVKRTLSSNGYLFGKCSSDWFSRSDRWIRIEVC
ncbi:hypothetical protein BsIDN1_00250 [Bacillus safensis]|uniref:Peptidase S11 D-alanyl-D-alanine carboxypeptidase A N-terminal domain-containing protein n=1 Tax=Bacillus safensis TaxID=561879 RepID=A0A5S9LY99_BACIA|nr:hypothetical protein BsIDN1_00250 [Bacillus safensis]